MVPPQRLYHLRVHLERRAYAKVNLALSVGPPEPPDPTTGGPGLHPIASWMHAVDLFDSVHLTWLGEAHLSSFDTAWAPDAPRTGPIDWPPESDLAVRALHLFQQSIGREFPAAMRIDKRIPVGGGLGGGSSDAAAVLGALRDRFAPTMSDHALAALAARLGSDVAFFLAPAPPPPAVVTGLGDRIARLPRHLAGRPIVLVFPAFGCPTGPVYHAYDTLGPRPLRERDVVCMASGGEEGLFNDLLPAAEKVQPALGPLRRAVEHAAGLPVCMSGSGSTLFLLPAAQEAERAAAKIAREVTDIAVLATRLI